MTEFRRHPTLILTLALLLALPALTATALGTGDGTTVDLSELRDGETRTFGTGDHTVTATREGDVVTVKFEDIAEHHAAARVIACNVSEDDCKIFVSDADDPQVIAFESGGEGERKEIVIRRVTDGTADGMAIVDIDRIVEGALEDVHGIDGDHEVHVIGETAGDDHDVWVDEDGGVKVVVRQHGGHPGRMMFIGEDDGARVRCPEGDTTMKLDDADAQYFCPKHKVLLEKVDRAPAVRRIEILKKEPSSEEL